MFPLLALVPPLTTTISSALGGLGSAAAASFVSKRITDHVISGKIGEFVEEGRAMIRKIYARFMFNWKLSLLLNGIIILCVLILWKIGGTHPGVKTPLLLVISFVSFFMMFRALVNAVRSLRLMYPHRRTIRYFLKKFFLFPPSFYFSVRQTIRMMYQDIYEQNTNAFSRGAHKVFSFFRFIKSTDEIEDEVVDEFYRLIRDFLLPYLVYRVIALTVFYSAFILLLKPLVFSTAIDMKVYEILLYPIFLFRRAIYAV
jgi:hypothetical protein